MKDDNGFLVQQTANVQSARQMRFTNVQEVVKQKTEVKTYIQKAIEVEKSGLKLPPKNISEFTIPENLKPD